MKKLDITTWKNLLDFLDMCDVDDTIIYAKIPTMSVVTMAVPIDNFELMKIASSKDPDDLTYMCIKEDDGVLYIN